MPITFNKENVFKDVPVEKMAEYFITTVDFKPSYQAQEISVNEIGEVRVSCYSGSVWFYDCKYMDELALNKLNEVIKIIKAAYNYSYPSNDLTTETSIKRLTFNIADGIIEITLLSPNKDCSIDFNRQSLLKSIRLARETEFAKQILDKLLSVFPAANDNPISKEHNTQHLEVSRIALNNYSWSSQEFMGSKNSKRKAYLTPNNLNDTQQLEFAEKDLPANLNINSLLQSLLSHLERVVENSLGTELLTSAMQCEIESSSIIKFTMKLKLPATTPQPTTERQANQFSQICR